MRNLLTSFKISRKIILPITGFISLGILLAYAAQSYRVTNGTMQTINEWSTARNVTNSCGVDIFVPTNSSAEWTSFINGKPGCVTVASAAANPCTIPWGGSVASGGSLNWYSGRLTGSIGNKYWVCTMSTSTCSNGTWSPGVTGVDYSTCLSQDPYCGYTQAAAQACWDMGYDWDCAAYGGCSG